MAATLDSGISYGDAVATLFDDYFALGDTESCVEFLSRYAGGMPAQICELGIGTGRLALPLVERGYSVTGVEISQSMIEQFRLKQLSDRVRMIHSDLVAANTGIQLDLVYCVDVTLNMIPDQTLQVRALQNWGRQLRAGGHLVLETTVPPLQDIWRSKVTVGNSKPEFLEFAIYDHDPGTQTLSGEVVLVRDSAVLTRYSARFRYIWPSELDLMAQLAGLKMVDRIKNWAGDPYVAGDSRFVSVYERIST
jgi:SAM-dependent methyltransferase